MSRRSSSLWIVLLVPLLGVALGFLLRTAALRAPANPPERGMAAAFLQAPLDFALSDLEGGSVRAEDFRGRFLLLDLWASWCGPCRAQAEILAPLAAEYADSVAFLAVNVGEDEPTVRRHLESEPLDYPVVLDPADTLGTRLQVNALPTVVLVGPEGRVHFLRQGITGAPQIRRELARLGVTPVIASTAT